MKTLFHWAILLSVYSVTAQALDFKPADAKDIALFPQQNSFPKSNYDFFPYACLHRAVWLYTVPAADAITDVDIRTKGR